MTRVAGVDGCRGGWVVASAEIDSGRLADLRVEVVPHFAEVLERSYAAVAVDIPIGLPDAAEPGGRACDRLARKMLGSRASSVFSPPVRSVLSAENYREALAINRASSSHSLGFTIQCWNIVPKIREVDGLLDTSSHDRVREAHPEVTFTVMSGSPMASPKRTAEGRSARRTALRDAGLGIDDASLSALPRDACAPDDTLDALALVWTAHRIVAASATSLPTHPPADSQGHPMRITA